MASVKNDRKKKVLTVVGVVILLIASALGIEIFPNKDKNVDTPLPSSSIQSEFIEGELQVHMIDVGQADCFLFIQGDKTALIDCGTRSTGKDAVEYIKELGITKLDYVIGTHPHDDHMGGMYDVITNFEIGKIIIPEVEAGKVTANWYMKLMAEITQNNYDVQYPEKDSVYSIGDAEMKVLGFTNSPSNVNNYSIVMMVSFGDMDIVMTGDAEQDLEKEILQSGVNVSAEILKAGHHGSDTSTSDEFLNAVDPEYALISAKVGNKYEHPIKSTMEKFEEKEIEVYRTDECGDVVLTVTSDNVTFSTEPGDYLSGVELEERNAS